MTDASTMTRPRWPEVLLVVVGLLFASVFGIQESMSDCFMCTLQELVGLVAGWIFILAGVALWQYHRGGSPVARLVVTLASWVGLAVAAVAIRLAIVAVVQGGI